MKKSGVGALVLVGLLVASDVRAESEGYLSDAGMGTGAVLVNLLYVPAKIVYATLGGVTGGFAYLLTGGNFEIADRIWAPSLGGNYLVTPAHLRNEQTLYFSGVVEPEPAASSFPPPPSEGGIGGAPGSEPGGGTEPSTPGTLGSEPHDPSKPPDPVVSPPVY